MDHKQILQQANDAITKAVEQARMKRNEEDRKYILAALGKDLIYLLEPFLSQIAENSRITREDFKKIISEIKVEAPQVNVSPQVDVKIPEVNVPPIIFPKEEMFKAIRKAFAGVQVKSPNVEVKPQDIIIPDKVEVKGIGGYFKTLGKAFTGKLNVGLEEVDRDNPLHVVLVDKKGNYSALGGGVGGIAVGKSGGGGGAVDIEEIDLSSQLTGSAKTFDLGKTVKSIILVNLNGTLLSHTVNAAKDKITLTFSPDADETLKCVVVL